MIALSVLFSCNLNQQKANKLEGEIKNNKCFVYPSVIDSLGIKNLYDSARWFVYTLHCDEKYLPKSDTTKFMTFGELPLSFKYANIKHDTLEIIFEFMDNKKAILSSMTRNYKETSTGVGFDIKTKTKIYMIFNGGTISYKGKNNRYANPLQPEVMNYIKSDWAKLDNCFRELAERNGIR